MRLEYENLTIRSDEDADIPFYVMWWNDGELSPENFVSFIK